MIWQVTVVFVLLPLIGQSLERGEQCTNQWGEKATCTNIYSCKAAIDAIAIANGTKLYATGIVCGYDTEPLVCCKTLADFVETSGSSSPASNSLNESAIDINIFTNNSIFNAPVQIVLELPGNNVSSVVDDNAKNSSQSNIIPNAIPLQINGDSEEPQESSESSTLPAESTELNTETSNKTSEESDECDCPKFSDDESTTTSPDTVGEETTNTAMKIEDLFTKFPENSNVVPDVLPLQSNESDSSTTNKETIGSSGEIFTSPPNSPVEEVSSTTTSTTEPPMNVEEIFTKFPSTSTESSVAEEATNVVPQSSSVVPDVLPLQTNNTSDGSDSSISGEIYTSPPESSVGENITNSVVVPNEIPLESNGGFEGSTETPMKVEEYITNFPSRSTESSAEEENSTFEHYGTVDDSSFYTTTEPPYIHHIENITTEVPIHHILPDINMCGVQAKRDRLPNAIIGTIDEFPWMALLSYQDANGKDVGFRCVGTLINDRYVITSAHCVTTGPQLFQLKSIRLGEWSLSSPTDCVPAAHKGMECPDKYVDVGIEKKTAHPNNNIALIRLERNVDFTKFVRPICLPIEHLRVPSEKTVLTTSGWGASEAGCLLDVKSKIHLSVLSKEVCSNTFFQFMRYPEDQVCVSATSKYRVCKADSGGPLMAAEDEDEPRWYLEGVIPRSFYCDKNGPVGKYTRVTDYISWIVSTLREEF